MAYGYTLLVYKKDARCKSGVRLVGTYPYNNYSGHAMMEEIKDLRYQFYKPSDGYQLDFEPFKENFCYE